MALKDSIKSGLKKNFDVKAWLGLKSIKRSNSVVRGLYQDVFQTKRRKEFDKTPQQSLSFDEAMAQYGLTEEGLQAKIKYSLLVLRIYLLLFAAMLVYMIYLFCISQLKAAFFVLVLVLVLLSYIFREHFNYYQMKQRRLGCTFKEWLNALVRGNA